MWPFVDCDCVRSQYFDNGGRPPDCEHQIVNHARSQCVPRRERRLNQKFPFLEMAGGAKTARAPRGLIEIALPDVYDLDRVDRLDEHLGDLLPRLENVLLRAQVNHDDLDLAPITGIHD
jgi:hypothetical protein